MNPLDELGGLLDETTKARMREIEEERKRNQQNLVIRSKLLALDQAREQRLAGPEATAKDADLQKFGTTDEATIRERKGQGGVYEDPKTLGLRMRTDQEALRAELEAQATGKTGQGATGDTHLYEGVGPGGERYFTNKTALANKGGAEEVGEYGDSSYEEAKERGGGTFSSVGGGTSDAQRFRDKASDALRRLNATPAEQATSDEVMGDFLKNRDYYRGLAEENGAEEAEQQMTADALDGKLPMHTVPHLSRMFASESRLFLQDSTQGLPPNRAYATARQEAQRRLDEQAAMQRKAHGLDLVKEAVENEPGGTLRPAVDTAKELARGDRAEEEGVAATQQRFLETPHGPEATPEARSTPAPGEDLIAVAEEKRQKRKKARETAEEALQRRARDAGVM